MRLSVALPDLNGLPDYAKTAAFEKLEVFVPPAALADADAVREATTAGNVSVHPIHHLPEVWADGVPRILRSQALENLARDRYLRDRFAIGPIALSVPATSVPTASDWGDLRAESAPFDAIVCASQAIADAIRVGVGEPAFRLDVALPAVDCDRFRPPSAAERSEARQALRLPEDATVAIYQSPVGPGGMGDLYPLVQAFAECAGPNDWLVIGGDPTTNECYAQLKTWAAAAGVPDRVRLLGCCRQSAIVQRLWAADIFVLACDTARFAVGSTVIEAMATGLPVIASDWAGLSESVRDGENGCLVPTCWVPGSARLEAFSSVVPEGQLLAQCVILDQAVLTSALAHLFSDATGRATLSAGARATALARQSVRSEEAARFQTQLQLATAEPAESRALRKQRSEGFVLSYDHLLRDQGTRPLGPDDILEWVTDRPAPQYAEVSILASDPARRAALESLKSTPKPLPEFESSPFEDSNYVLATLLKRNVIRLANRS